MTPKNLSLKHVSSRLHGPGIRVIKISRREALNALNTETLHELKHELNEEAKDAKVRVVVLTGAGDKAFIAGADIAEMKDKTVKRRRSFRPARSRGD